MEHPKFCRHCGTAVVGVMKFCTSCGRSVIADGSAPPPVIAPPAKRYPDWAILLVIAVLVGLGWLAYDNIGYWNGGEFRGRAVVNNLYVSGENRSNITKAAYDELQKCHVDMHNLRSVIRAGAITGIYNKDFVRTGVLETTEIASGVYEIKCIVI